jgi:hypothetical protein
MAVFQRYFGAVVNPCMPFCWNFGSLHGSVINAEALFTPKRILFAFGFVVFIPIFISADKVCREIKGS